MLLTDSDISNIDQQRLYLIYEEWPKYFKDAANIYCKLDHEPDFYESVVLCGMGGSATSCDILHDLIHMFSMVPSSVVRGQNIPYNVNKHSMTTRTNNKVWTDKMVYNYFLRYTNCRNQTLK